MTIQSTQGISGITQQGQYIDAENSQYKIEQYWKREYGFASEEIVCSFTRDDGLDFQRSGHAYAQPADGYAYVKCANSSNMSSVTGFSVHYATQQLTVWEWRC